MNNARIFEHINVIYPSCTIVVTYFNPPYILNPIRSYFFGSSLMCMYTHTYTHSHTQLFWLFFPVEELASNQLACCWIGKSK